MDKSQLCISLMKWLEKTFHGSPLTVPDLTDGCVMAKALHQIDPANFSNQWLAKIKPDVADNWRLKASNLRKLLDGIVEYDQENLQQGFTDYSLPDVNKIGEHGDQRELGHLLQLILGCAVNCAQKQTHIEAIMQMEESVQAVIMDAIQELFSNSSAQGVRIPSESDGVQSQIDKLLEQLEAASLEKQSLGHRMAELDQQVMLLSEEKKTLLSNKEELESKVQDLSTGLPSGQRYKELKKQIEGLQDELYKIETSRDEYRVRVEVLERETSELQTRNEDLLQLAEEARSLKDDVDALRDMKEKVPVLETQVESYKKKLEEMSDLRRQVKLLQDKNSDYQQQNQDLEEERKKSGTWRHQLDLYKKQVGELHQKLNDEQKKSDRLDFEKKKADEKLQALLNEKERLVHERDELKESRDRLEYQQLNPPHGGRPHTDSDENLFPIMPTQTKEKLTRLQKENDEMREKTGVLQAMLSDLEERQQRLQQENRDQNKKVLELECELQEARLPEESGAAFGRSSSGGEARRISELERKLAVQAEKCTSLEETLSRKEGEMAAMEERYKKYLGKAKSVIKTLDPKHNPGLIPDVSTLRSQIHEKERIIDTMERENEKSKSIREMEEKMITTAFYNFGMQMHRQMIQQRLSTMDQGQSFIARQRQASSRRGPMGNSEFFDY